MNRKRRRLILLNVSLVVVLLLVASGAYVWLFRPTGSDPSGVRAFRVARGTVKATATASGTVAPKKSANVDFDTSGTVENINVTERDTVSKGEVLARLDDSAQRQALTAARSKLTAAKDSLVALEDEETCDDSTSSSTVGGGGGNAGGGQTSCTTQSQVSSAQANVDSARAGVSQAKADLAATKLKAPIAGTVVAVNGTVGSSASAGSSGAGSSGSSNSSGGGSSGGSSSGGSLDTSSGFVVIATLHHLVVDASLAEADVAKIEKSQHATVTFPALTGKSAKGKVTSIDLAGTTSNNVVSYGATVALSSVPKAIRLGQTASVSIVTAKATNVLYVPTVAVHKGGGTSTVQLLQNGHQVTRTVKTGIEGGQTTEITSGLKEGDQVVLVTATRASQAASNQNGQSGGGGVVRRHVPGGGGAKPTLVQRP